MELRTRNPIRTKAKGLMRKFLNRIDQDAGEDTIPELTNGQWRCISAVLATYRMMVDEEYMTAETELAKLDYSRLSNNDLDVLAIRYRTRPEVPLAQSGDNGQELFKAEEPTNGGGE